MNFQDDFFRSEVEFGTVQDKNNLTHRERICNAPTWPVRMLINWVSVAAIAVGAASMVEPRIYAALPTTVQVHEAAIEMTELADLRSLVDRIQAGKAPMASQEFVKEAERVAMAIEMPSAEPDQRDLVFWLSDFISSADDC
jgi:hypothetical protein